MVLAKPNGFHRTVWLDGWASTYAGSHAGFPSLLIVEGDGEVWMWDGYLMEG